MANSVLDPARYPVLSDEHLRHARIVPSRLAALTLWPQDAVIAEVGVALGEFSKAILALTHPLISEYASNPLKVLACETAWAKAAIRGARRCSGMLGIRS